MTPRIRRELPASFAARVLLTWLTPGPATGVVFASACITVLAGFSLSGYWYWLQTAGRLARPGIWDALWQTHVLIAAYSIGMLTLVRLVVAVVRINNHPRVEIGFATLIAIAVVLALVPYAIGLHLNDYRPYAYSWWQLTNWAWTIQRAAGGSSGGVEVTLVVVAVSIFFGVALFSAPSVVMPRRVSTPQRVQLERAKQALSSREQGS
jgi:hypothetical protein